VHEERINSIARRGAVGSSKSNGNEAAILKSTNEALDALWGTLSAVHASRAN